MAPKVSPWRKVLSIALMVVGGLCGLAVAFWLFRLTWSAIPTLQYSWRPTVLFLVGLLFPLAGGFFVYGLAVALGERVRSGPAQTAAGRNPDLSLLAQLGMAYGLFVGVAISAYDSYVASDNLGRSTNFGVFFVTGVVPVINGLLAGGPLFLLSLAYWEEIGRRAQLRSRPPLTLRSALRLIAYAAGGVMAAGSFFVGYKVGWTYFFQDAVLRGEWPRAFWVVVLFYGAALIAWAVCYPFLAFAKTLKHPAD